MNYCIDKITPVIICYNEISNIRNTLNALKMFRRIVVLDSGSDDGTTDVIGEFENVDLFYREFDTFEKQWNFAISETNILTSYVLALDSDYILTPDLIIELQSIDLEKKFVYEVSFRLIFFDRDLGKNFYPNKVVLFKLGFAKYIQDGHTQKLVCTLPTKRLKKPILLDDRKNLDRWLKTQIRYADEESIKLTTFGHDLNWVDKLRKKLVIVPLLMVFYLLIIKRFFLKREVGIYYIYQRLIAEMLLTLKIIEIRKNSASK